MNIQTDLDINRAIRRLLVKHWIDLGRISVRTTGGSVSIFGLLQRVEGRAEPLTPPTVEGMMYEIRRIDSVKAVRAHLDNWINDGGRWRQHERASLQDQQEDAPTGPSVASE